MPQKIPGGLPVSNESCGVPGHESEKIDFQFEGRVGGAVRARGSHDSISTGYAPITRIKDAPRACRSASCIDEVSACRTCAAHLHRPRLRRRDRWLSSE